MVWTTVLAPDIIVSVSIRQPNASSKSEQGSGEEKTYGENETSCCR